MFKKIIIAIVFLGNTLLFGQTGGSIKGKISDNGNSETIPFAEITLKKDGRFFAVTISDLDGNFGFRGLSPGVYTVKASAIGYYGYTVLNLHVDSVVVNQNMEMDESFIVDSVKVFKQPSNDPVNLVVMEDVSEPDVISETAEASGIADSNQTNESASIEDVSGANRIPETVRPAIIIYPNPVREYASIVMDSDLEISGGFIRFYDLSGMEVRTLPFFGKIAAFERGGLAAGTYLFEVYAKDISITGGRLVLQ
jgi:hypothetical protein